LEDKKYAACQATQVGFVCRVAIMCAGVVRVLFNLRNLQLPTIQLCYSYLMIYVEWTCSGRRSEQQRRSYASRVWVEMHAHPVEISESEQHTERALTAVPLTTLGCQQKLAEQHCSSNEHPIGNSQLSEDAVAPPGATFPYPVCTL
jgi:hypothetical protein